MGAKKLTGSELNSDRRAPAMHGSTRWHSFVFTLIVLLIASEAADARGWRRGQPPKTLTLTGHIFPLLLAPGVPAREGGKRRNKPGFGDSRWRLADEGPVLTLSNRIPYVKGGGLNPQLQFDTPPQLVFTNKPRGYDVPDTQGQYAFRVVTNVADGSQGSVANSVVRSSHRVAWTRRFSLGGTKILTLRTVQEPRRRSHELEFVVGHVPDLDLLRDALEDGFVGAHPDPNMKFTEVPASLREVPVELSSLSKVDLARTIARELGHVHGTSKASAQFVSNVFREGTTIGLKWTIEESGQHTLAFSFRPQGVPIRTTHPLRIERIDPATVFPNFPLTFEVAKFFTTRERIPPPISIDTTPPTGWFTLPRELIRAPKMFVRDRVNMENEIAKHLDIELHPDDFTEVSWRRARWTKRKERLVRFSHRPADAPYQVDYFLSMVSGAYSVGPMTLKLHRSAYRTTHEAVGSNR